MGKSYIPLTVFKWVCFVAACRKIYFKAAGLKMGTGVLLGKITCQWPQRLALGNHCEVEDNVIFKIHKPFAGDNYINIGERVFIGNGCEFNCNTKIIIGNDCLIASKTTMVDTGHEISRSNKIRLQPCTIQEIIISDDVWIGTQCIVLKGVTIGDGSIIGAGSLVNKSVPPYQVWAGVPAKFIRNRV